MVLLGCRDLNGGETKKPSASGNNGCVNQGRTVLSQLMSFLPDREFRRCVVRYGGDARPRGFSCWDQYLSMAFAQLTYRDGLRDIEACLRSLGGKLYHMGFRRRVRRSECRIGSGVIPSEILGRIAH